MVVGELELEVGVGVAAGSLPSEAQPPIAIATAVTVARSAKCRAFVMAESWTPSRDHPEKDAYDTLPAGRLGRRIRIVRHIRDLEPVRFSRCLLAPCDRVPPLPTQVCRTDRTAPPPALTGRTFLLGIHVMQNEVGSLARALWTTRPEPGAVNLRGHLHAKEVCDA
ncbi:hypothetical protein Pve01_93680 [Planomonospora venezuelensis]|nr:hypothetical protein Pve01_93680 [Planomonospora venezuelensis]